MLAVDKVHYYNLRVNRTWGSPYKSAQIYIAKRVKLPWRCDESTRNDISQQLIVQVMWINHTYKQSTILSLFKFIIKRFKHFIYQSMPIFYISTSAPRCTKAVHKIQPTLYNNKKKNTTDRFKNSTPSTVFNN